MQYRGFTYRQCREYVGKAFVTRHEVYTPEGRSIKLDWAPATDFTYEDFTAWVDLGMSRAYMNRATLQDLSRSY